MTEHLVSTAPRPAVDVSETLLAPRPIPRPSQRVLFGDTADLPFRWLRGIRS